MKKKMFIAAMSAASILALTSCGGGSNVANAGEEFKLISLEELKGEETTVVEFWHSFGDAISPKLQTLVEKFETKMQSDGYNIDVKLTNVGGGYDGLRSRVNLGIRSNSIPTMLLGYPDHFADYISNDILLPLDSYVNSTEYGLDGVTSSSNDFIESYWQENQLSIKGSVQTAGIPFNKSTEIMVYNSEVVDPILKSLGYVEKVGDPWVNPTWEQVFAVSQYVVNNKDTITWQCNGTNKLRDVRYPVYVDSESNFFITTARQWGGEGNYTTVDENGNGTVHVNTSTNKTAQEYFYSKAQAGLFQFPKKVSQNYGSAAMNTLSAVISIGSTAGIKNNTSAKYTLKATGIPQKSYEANENQAVIQQGTNLAILTKNSNNKTRLASWLLIKYLTDTENTEWFSKETGYLPVRTSALESDTYQTFLAGTENTYENMTTFMVARAINAAFSQKDYFYTDPAFSGSSICRDYLETLVKDMFIMDKSFKDAVDAYNKSLKDLKLNVEE